MKNASLMMAMFLLILTSSCAHSDALKDYRVNANNYVDQTISFTAKVIDYGSPDVEILQDYGVGTYYYKFADQEGYFVNVISKNRKFEMNNIYSVSGKYIKTSAGNYYLIE